MFAEAVLDQKLTTLLRLHEEAFRQLGGVPEQILYDRMKTVWQGVDERGEVVWNPVFLDFARYWGFQPRLCRPYRAQTKGKVESGVKYVRRNFVCGLQGREPHGVVDLNTQMHEWLWTIANQRVHGTTHEQVWQRWEAEREQLQRVDNRPPYPFAEDEVRTVARDAYVAWRGSRYSVPWPHVGREVAVREADGQVEVRWGGERIAVHARAERKHAVVTCAEHHRGIPLGATQRESKLLVHMRQSAPLVETRPLAVYDRVAGGGR